MTEEQIIKALRAANQVAQRVMEGGKHPFGAVLIGPDAEEVLMEQGNVSTVKHAESELARAAAERYDEDFLWKCSLVTNFEPCVMCTGTIYWANIGRIVYGATEDALLSLTGDHEENPTFALPCRTVLAAGQKSVEVIGPVKELESEILKLHQDFWA
ncbi:MAG: nucleoside deaminase [Verrucomicrobiota bacterium]